MGILGIISILITLFFIVFFCAAIYILIVFVIRLRKNAVLNKSVAKSVFNGKLSLIVILLFFGISFAFVGGMQLSMTNGRKSILNTFEEGKVWQYEIEDDGIFDKGDDTLDKLARYYNEDHFVNINTSYATPGYEVEYISAYNTIIDPDHEPFEVYDVNAWENDPSTIPTDVTEFLEYMDWKVEDLAKTLSPNKENSFRTWLIENGYAIENDAFNNYIFAPGNYFKNAVYYATYNRFKILDENIQMALEVLFTNDIASLSKFLVNTNTIININKLYPELTSNYKLDLRGYYHFAPKNGSVNQAYEFVVYPDFIKEQNVSKTLGLDYNEFINMSSDEPNIYNVVVQEDYMEANGLKPGDKINLIGSTKLNIVDTVRFSEVTYGMMGANFLVDEEKQAFVGIKASDFIKLISSLSTEQYTSLYNRPMAFYLRDVNPEHDKKLRQADWIGEKTTFIDWRIENTSGSMKVFNESVSFLRLNEEELESILQAPLGGTSISWFKERTNQLWNIDSDSGEFMGVNTSYDGMAAITQFDSPEAARALIGLLEMRGTQSMINILVLVFMGVILIVLSLLIAKRINGSGKQLGTLKAMGMENKQIASAYILFPLIMVGIGFILAALVSPLVMMLFNNILANYYYISFTAMPLSVGFFWTLLVIPMLLSIGLCYFISIRVLRKPTLDLLANKGKDAPNIFVRAAGYITPAKTPFTISYAGKGVLRAMGKSMLLFMSVFLSVFLTSFAMSTTTMIETQTEQIMSYLNYDAFALGGTTNFGQYQYTDMYDADGNLTYEGLDTLDINTKWLIQDEEGFLSSLSTEAASLVLDYSTGKADGFYITSESMIVLSLAEVKYGGFDIPELDYAIARWVAQATQDAYNYKQNSDNPTMQEYITLMPDLVIGNYYANQHRDAVLASTSFSSEHRAYNSELNDDFEQWYEVSDKTDLDVKGKESPMFSVLTSKEQFLNSWGSEPETGQQIWEESLAPYYEKIMLGEQLDYIPVIASTQSRMLLDKLSETYFTTEDGTSKPMLDKLDEDTYEISVSINTSLTDQSGLNPEPDKLATSVYVKARVKVVYDVFVGFDMGLVTITEFLKNYFSNYEENQPTAVNDQRYNDYVVGEDWEFSPSWTYRYTNRIEIAEGEEKYSPLSIVPQSNSYNDFMADPAYADKTITFEQILTGESPIKYSVANGTFISVETMLSQGAKVYDMMMAMFVLMSVFIIFMATTVIVIAMKDVIDSSKREVSMLKAFGYSNTKATFLIMIPYIIVSALAFFIALPMTFAGLAAVASLLTSVTGNVFIFTLTLTQWILVIGYVYGLIGLLTILGFISFYKTNALEAIRASDE